MVVNGYNKITIIYRSIMIPSAANEPQNQKMSITIGPDQLIKFPTITKLTYDGTNSHLNKTLYRNSTRSIIKSTSPGIPSGAANSFRVIEVAPDDNLMRICMMNIHGPDQKYKTAPRDGEEDGQNLNKRSTVMALLRKQRSQSLLSSINYTLGRGDHQNRITNHTTLQSSNSNSKIFEEQSRRKSKTQSLIKFKLNNRAPQTKLSVQQIYLQVMKALALVNGKSVICHSKSYQRIKRAKIEKGNNGYMVKQTIKKRNWWNITDDIKEANFVWTERTLKSIVSTEEREPFYVPIIQQEARLATFQRNIDQALINYPKMLQLLFMEDEINKIMSQQVNKNYKMKKPSTVYNYLASQKATRKIQSDQVTIYNHIPNNFEITSKKMLYKNLWRYYHHQKRDPYLSIPKTYHLTIFDWQEKIQFVKSEQKGPLSKSKQGGHDAWFLKPGENTNRGRGIQMFNETSAALDYIVRNPPKSVNKTYILQEYIDPLLYEGRKFDIRCYMLCVQAFECQAYYWYEEGYIRTSSSKFTMSKTSVSIHLTNDAVQKEFNNYDKYESANKLSYLEIDKYLKNEHGFDFLGGIVPQMKRIATDVCKAATDMGIHKNNNQEQDHCEGNEIRSEEYPALYFQIFGLDFIIGKSGNPFLLEVNTNPCLEINSNLLSRVIPEMVENTFRLVSDVYLPNKTSTSSTGLCPDWAQSFILNNKFSLIHRRELETKNNECQKQEYVSEGTQEKQV